MTHIEPAAWEQELQAVSTEFRERFDMFEEAGQITSLSRWLTENALARIAHEFGLVLTEDNASQFVTHFAMALSRLQRGEFAEASAVVADELSEHERERDVIRKVVEEIEQVLDREVPDSEIDYMTVHLCVLLEDE
jgi:transcriptional regulatory protein LevR